MGTDQPAAAIPHRTALVLVAALSMLQPLSTDLYLPTLPGIAQHFAAPVATVQWTLSIFIAGFGLWQLVAGPLADRYGRRPVILAGVTTYALASLLCLLAPNIELLIAGRLAQALGACSCLVGIRGAVRDLYAPAAGAKLLAAAATWMALAPLIGPVAGALLYERFGWRSAFALVLVFALALLWLAARRLRETLVRPNPQALDLRPMLATYAQVARSPTFRAYAAASSASYAGLFAYISGSSFVLMRIYGLSVVAYGFCFAGMVAGYLAGTLICRQLLTRRGMQPTLYAGAAVQAVAGLTLALLAVAGVHQALAIVLPMMVYGVSHGIVQPPAQAGAVAPFPQAAGAAAALLGFVMMGVAAAVGVGIGASYNGTVYPLTLTIGATSVASLLIAATLIRRHGDVSRHG